jgi:hypothetical protein
MRKSPPSGNSPQDFRAAFYRKREFHVKTRVLYEARRDGKVGCSINNRWTEFGILWSVNLLFPRGKYTMRLYGSLMDLKSLYGRYEDVGAVFVQID